MNTPTKGACNTSHTKINGTKNKEMYVASREHKGVMCGEVNFLGHSFSLDRREGGGSDKWHKFPAELNTISLHGRS